MHEHKECHGDHHGGVIINPDIATCRHCQLTLPVDRSDPLAMVDTMLMHMARVHPTDFESYAQKAAAMFGRPTLVGLTAAGFLDYQSNMDKDENIVYKPGGYL